ncbi:MAG TPA: hypothetical protein VD947_02980, partial [Patescibacteria group bacterium]|nr:hypothetical protein [Patescibacteria group bacterium]
CFADLYVFGLRASLLKSRDCASAINRFTSRVCETAGEPTQSAGKTRNTEPGWLHGGFIST